MIMPLEIKGNTLRVAMHNATDIYALEALEAHTKKRIEISIALAVEM